MAETMTFEAPAFTARGTRREAVRLPEATFDGVVHMPVMHQAVKAFLANQRQGNAATKTRGLVIGGNRKPWKQKGTGRARQGSTRAPNWVGGGTVFGPTPRAYDQYVPKQVRQLARRSAFNARARENAVMVIDRFAYEAPKTKALLALLERLGVADRKVLILTDGVKPNVWLSGRNLPTAHVMPYSDASTYHILWSDVVLIEAGAIGQELTPVAETEAEEAARPAAGSAAPAEGAAPTPRAARKTAGAAKKAGAKKTAAKSGAKAAGATKGSRTASPSGAKKPSGAKGAAKKKKGK